MGPSLIMSVLCLLLIEIRRLFVSSPTMRVWSIEPSYLYVHDATCAADFRCMQTLLLVKALWTVLQPKLVDFCFRHNSHLDTHSAASPKKIRGWHAWLKLDVMDGCFLHHTLQTSCCRNMLVRLYFSTKVTVCQWNWRYCTDVGSRPSRYVSCALLCVSHSTQQALCSCIALNIPREWIDLPNERIFASVFWQYF